MASSSKRRDLTLKEKVSVIEYARQSACNQAEVAKKFGVSQSQVSKLLKRKDSILSDFQGNFKSTRKRKRNGKNAAVDEALNRWAMEKRACNVQLSGIILKKKAEQIAQTLGNADFRATNGWFCRWKNRSQMTFKKVAGKASDADVTAANVWTTDILPSLLKNYKADCIYNCDETALYFRAIPAGTFCFRGEISVGVKAAKDRITVLSCVNSDGSHKLPLFVVGKSKSPKYFKGLKSLPVKYTSNKNAWMTTALFKEWILDFNKLMEKANKKVLLFMDNCSAHKSDVQLSNVNIHYLPAYASLIQPMNQGVISIFKRNYRREILKKIISRIDSYDHPSTENAINISRKISVFAALHMMNKAWNKIPATHISNCFIKCKFLSGKEQEMANPEETHPEVTGEVLSKFVSFDDSLPVCDIDEDFACKITEENKEDEDLEKGAVLKNTIPSTEEVRLACDIIKRFLQSKINVDFKHFYNLEQQIREIICKNNIK